MTDTRIDILRHGEPEGGQKYRGHGVDDPLSELGWRQMWAAVGNHLPWDRVVSSPMKRCRPFAEAVAEKKGLPLRIDDRLREVGFGAWEGRTGNELRTADPDAIRRFYADPIAARPAGAEPLDHFRERVSLALQQILDSDAGRHVLVVAHAGVMRASLSWLLQIPPERMYRVDIPNAAFLRLRADSERPAMLCLDGPSVD
jgi:broad specificity phosphatase PhoE